MFNIHHPSMHTAVDVIGGGPDHVVWRDPNRSLSMRQTSCDDPGFYERCRGNRGFAEYSHSEDLTSQQSKSSSNHSSLLHSTSSRGHSRKWLSPRQHQKADAAAGAPAQHREGGADHVLFGSSPSQSAFGSSQSQSGSAEDSAEIMTRQQSSPPKGSSTPAMPTTLNEDENVMSVGSALHDQDMCRPCLFVYTKVGCQNGARCEFCHFAHKRKNKPRPCKGKRDRYRKLINRMEQQMEDAKAQGQEYVHVRQEFAQGAAQAAEDTNTKDDKLIMTL
jgi:hypothetical protein